MYDVRCTAKEFPLTKARYIMIGGFLGAGKTTAILKLAAHFKAQGLRVGLITNDQSVDLVDTARARSAGYSVEEITGGCFCCKFDSLVEASKTLTDSTKPDVFIAEPVGSCTDLKATVSYPLRELYGDAYLVAPLTVLVDPKRAQTVLGLSQGKSFSEKVIYVYRKQLEEAEIIVIHKADLLDDAARKQLKEAMQHEFPQAKVMVASSISGEGLDAMYEAIAADDLGSARTMEVDYDVYADGEALLGWVNIKGTVSSDEEFDGNALIADLAARLRSRMATQGNEVAHLKMTLAPDKGSDMASNSLTRSDENAQPTHHLAAPIRAGELMVNLRAEADPQRLRDLVLETLAALPAVRFSLGNAAAFRPGRPTPTHRMTT